MVLIDYIFLSMKSGYLLVTKGTQATSRFVSGGASLHWLIILRNFYIPLGFGIFFVAGFTGFCDRDYFYLLLCLVFPLQSLLRDSFLSLWFLLFFFPFLWVFTEQVHLAYALLPTAIITSMVLEDIYEKVHQRLKRPALVKCVFCFLVVVGITDQALNLYGSYKVVNATNDGIHSVSHWIRKNLAEHSVIVTNALHMENIRLHTNDWVTIFYTVKAGIAREKAGITIEPEALEKLLKQNHGKHDFYFVDVDFDYTLDKVNYHSHKYVRNNSVAVEDLGVIHITQVRYPYLDPVKAYVPRSFISFLGPPDLENDFYRGPARDNKPFMREVYAEYHIYKVVGTQVDPWVAQGPLKMVKEAYKGFNILCLNGRFFAVPQGEGHFDLNKVWRKKYSHNFISDSYHEIQKQIDNLSGNDDS
jgi:hypothetical protein